MHEIERFLQDFYNDFELLRVSYRFDSCCGCHKSKVCPCGRPYFYCTRPNRPALRAKAKQNQVRIIAPSFPAGSLQDGANSCCLIYPRTKRFLFLNLTFANKRLQKTAFLTRLFVCLSFRFLTTCVHCFLFFDSAKKFIYYFNIQLTFLLHSAIIYV